MIIPKKDKLSKTELKQVEDIASASACSILNSGRIAAFVRFLEMKRKKLCLSGSPVFHLFGRWTGLSLRISLWIEDLHFLIIVLKLEKWKWERLSFYYRGPCTIDPANQSLFLETAHALKEAGVNGLRGGVWKPRTNPYSYQGDNKSLEIILKAREETGLPIDIEVMDSDQLKLALEAKVDVLQVGTRNALNYSLLKEIGNLSAGSNASVLLKRGRHVASPNEFIAAAEYIVAEGNPNVMLCPRGTTPTLDGYRNQPDESISPLLKAEPGHRL